MEGSKISKGWQINSLCIWSFIDYQFKLIKKFSINEINIGESYNAVTEYILGSANSSIGGNQCGTVMAMASMYSPYVHIDIARRLVINPNKKEIIGELANTFGDEPTNDTSYSLAASFQLATEEWVRKLIEPYLTVSKNLIFSGGVSLNSVMIGNLSKQLYSQGYKIFIPPVPYDAGLSLGATQFMLGIKGLYNQSTNKFACPYMGKKYNNSDIKRAINSHIDQLKLIEMSTLNVCSLLNEGKIVALYSGSSESGRRALGNRSILSDPRKRYIKDEINNKVKHRQWYRPFAPVLLSKYVSEIFDTEVDSPYMSFVVKIKEEMQSQYPGVVHLDGTGRLQTIDPDGVFKGSIIFEILSIMDSKFDCKMLLNTSFNDREPIVETPSDAINCFLRTSIDYLFFADENILVKKI